MPETNPPASVAPDAAAYRRKAERLNAAAEKTNDRLIRAELENLASAYARLAEKAERAAVAPPARTNPADRADEV